MSGIRSKRAGVLAFFLALVFFVSMCLPAVPVRADEGEIDETPVDFVLVIDCSGTMPANDPNKLVAAGTKMFIDLLPEGRACRLGIVVFGVDYGAEAYNICPDDTACRNLIKVAFPLQDFTRKKVKTAAKKIIDVETAKSGPLSPVGYAMKAASKMLADNGAARNNAAIILMTDGQVEGQQDGYNPYLSMYMDYTSMEESLSVASSNGWDVYGMELNFAGGNTKDATNYGAIGYYQMRENIPKKTGTAPIELRDTAQAQEKFQEIIDKFFKTVTTTTVTGPHYEENVGEMIAEWSVTFTSEVLDKVTGFTVTTPDGREVAFDRSDDTQVDGNMAAVFDKQYIMLKVYAPASGKWCTDMKGVKEGEGTFTAASVRMTQTNLALYSSAASGEIDAQSTVEFKAAYEYGDRAFVSDTFYKDHPAKLYINDKPVMDMSATSEGYLASYTFEKKGSYSVYARVDDEGFRNGFKASGKFLYTIDNEPTYPKGQIPDISADCGKEADGIRLDEYFDSPDGDALIYSVDYDKTVNIRDRISPDGVLTMLAGSQAGVYPVTVKATDGSDKDEATQTFNFEVTNQPLAFTGSEEDMHITVELSPDSDKYPKQMEFRWDRFFSDPDGQPPRIAVLEDKNEDSCITWMQDRERTGITFTAEKSGKATFSVVGMDDNDILVNYTIVFDVTSRTNKDIVVGKFGLPVGILAVLLIAAIGVCIFLFTGRKIYGTWDIYTSSGGNEPEIRIGSTGSGKRAKCNLDRLLAELDMDNGFGKVTLEAGSKLSKSVFVTNLNGMEVEIDGMPEEDPKKLKKVEIRRGHEIRITSPMLSVTLTRIG